MVITGSALLQFRILTADLARLRRLAQREGKSLAEYCRAALGVEDPPRGGAREGAGRARRQSAVNSASDSPEIAGQSGLIECESCRLNVAADLHECQRRKGERCTCCDDCMAICRGGRSASKDPPLGGAREGAVRVKKRVVRP